MMSSPQPTNWAAHLTPSCQWQQDVSVLLPCPSSQLCRVSVERGGGKAPVWQLLCPQGWAHPSWGRWRTWNSPRGERRIVCHWGHLNLNKLTGCTFWDEPGAASQFPYPSKVRMEGFSSCASFFFFLWVVIQIFFLYSLIYKREKQQTAFWFNQKRGVCLQSRLFCVWGVFFVAVIKSTSEDVNYLIS